MADITAKVEITAIDSATRVFNQVGAAAKNLEKGYGQLKTAFESAIAGLAVERVVSATVEWEKAGNRLNAVLRATSSAAGLSRRELDDMAASLSESTPFNERDIRAAEANLLKFGNIHEQVFREALKLSADYAAFTGGDMVGASQAIGRALADPVNGLKALQREFGNLTFTQKEYIATLEAAGKTEEAQAAVLDIVRDRIGGTAAGSNTGLTQAVGELSKNWDKLIEKIGNTDRVRGMAGGLSILLQQIRDFNQPATAGASGSWGQSAEEATLAAAAAADRDTLAENRLKEAHARAVPTLEAWRRQLSETTREDQARILVLRGEAKTWNELDQAALLTTARELDRRKNLAEVIDAQGASLRMLMSAQDHADDVQRQRVIVNHEQLDQMQFELALIGKTAYEVEKLNAERQIELRTRAELRAAAEAAGDDSVQNDASRAAIRKGAEEQTRAVLNGLRQRREAERSWATGTKNAFNEYIDHATNAAEQASFLFTNMFHNMEDAVVNFVMTGKLDFKSFANSVIADIVRIQVRMAIASGASNSGFAAFAGSLFGPRAGSDSSAGGFEPGFEGHSGGVVGSDLRPRPVDPAWFHGAARMHMGGLAGDEVPVILQRGERVLPRGAGAGGVHVHINIQTGVAQTVRAEMLGLMPAIRDTAVAGVLDAQRRSPFLR